MTGFRIHEQLLADGILLGRFEVCHLLLHANASLPWFILVPETTETDLLDLPAPLRDSVMRECSLASEYIKGQMGCNKVNFAAIGNLVPQLHLHVVGRSLDDPCWPKPVWGNLPPGPGYDEKRLAEIRSALAGCFQLRLMSTNAGINT